MQQTLHTLQRSALSAALLLGLGASGHVSAQSVQEQRALAQSTIATLANIAAQSSDKPEVMQAAIAAIARIATTGDTSSAAPVLSMVSTAQTPAATLPQATPTRSTLPPRSAAPRPSLRIREETVVASGTAIASPVTTAPETVGIAPVPTGNVAQGGNADSPWPASAPAAPAAVRSASGRYTFNANRLAFPVDLQMYTDGNPVMPGVYRLDLYMNNVWLGKHDIRFANQKADDRVAQPCFDAELIDLLGLDTQQFKPETLARLQAGESLCGAIEELVPGTDATFDTGEQKLLVTAAQAVLLRLPRGYVNPKRWDYGVNAVSLAYNYNAYSNQFQDNATQTSHYLGLRLGVNVGAWRFRYRGTFNRAPHSDTTHVRDSMYLERAVPSLRSRFVVGDTSTSGHVFDSLSLRGAQLVTDTSMRPDSQNSFVPIIRGIAQSNAKVTVEQRGEQIFEMSVPPGPFVIDDLYPNGRGGDLLVTITEADGSKRDFTVTYANLPEMLRPGTLYYSAAVGRYRNRMLTEDEPVLGMLTGSYGFNNTVTGYGGVLGAQGYHAFALGAGLNLPIGAVTADMTWANARGLGETTRGWAFRVGYTKMIEPIASDVTLAMYRYATQGYVEPDRAFQLRDLRTSGTLVGSGWGGYGDKRRHQFALRLDHQPMAGWGALSLSASLQDYWNRAGYDHQYQVGYGQTFGSVSLGLNVSRSRNIYSDRWENQYMLTMALPLGQESGNSAYLNSSYALNDNNHLAQATLSGTLGEQHQIGYSLFTSGDKQKGRSATTAGGGTVSVNTPVARVSASASTSSSSTRQLSVSASGGVLAYGNGVILAPEMGETVGIIQAPGAAGATLAHNPGVVVNARGHALVPYLQAYRENDVMLDPKGVSTDVEMASTNQKVAPTDGAVVLLNYDTRTGYAVLLQGQRRNGSALPFGAAVLNAQGHNVGYVAQGGQALIRADAPQGSMTVRWGASEDQRCSFDYNLQSAGVVNQADETGFRRLEVTCL